MHLPSIFHLAFYLKLKHGMVRAGMLHVRPVGQMWPVKTKITSIQVVYEKKHPLNGKKHLSFDFGYARKKLRARSSFEMCAPGLEPGVPN